MFMNNTQKGFILLKLIFCVGISFKCDPEDLDLTHVMQTLANENIEGLPPGGGLSSK